MKGAFTLFFFFLIQIASAQLVVRPLASSGSQAKLNAQQGTSISLPFWDDFSAPTQQLDTAWWTTQSQTQVIVKPGIAINAPTIGVATFDGINALGEPYLPTPSDGPVDSMVSQPIDLTQVPANLRTTVYLSFFYEARGLGEAPEESDSLVLYFKNDQGLWDKVWPKSNQNYETDPTLFTEVFVQVSNSKYYHGQFQFMFKAKGRQNGWLDNWLVDYVYMDKNRSATDNSYLDRSYVEIPEPIFANFTAMPYDDFLATVKKSDLFQNTSLKIRNFENDIAPGNYSVKLTDTLTGNVLETIANSIPFVIKKKSVLDTLINPVDGDLWPTNVDSLVLEMEYSMDSGDTLLIESIDPVTGDTTYYNTIDLTKNDTLRKYITLNNYYAYDDGTAEYGAGVNQPLSKIAYRFSTNVGKYLNRIDIYFPNIDGVKSGIPLELFVLNDFEGTENSLLLTSNIAINHTGINKFISYELPTSLFVADTFYIGLTNLSSNNQWLTIGLDKNTDSFDQIFVNIDGTWTPNTTVHGSLMMRPYFTDQPPVLGIGAIKEDIEVYPNPSHGWLKINSTFTHVNMFDLLGHQIPIEIRGNEIRYSVSKKSIALVQIFTPKGIFTKKIAAMPNQ